MGEEVEVKNAKNKLSVPATVILTLVATLGIIVLARIVWFFFVGR